ncbi:LysR family transcriptional regulator [Microbacterium sp. OR21]|uniref:LysR family transcriptional regulator n=1 Tax=Microbacterium sp. OR21 TaxID=3095346 RepID=UPI0039B4A3BE
MTSRAEPVCTIADVNASTTPSPDPHDLLILLEVSRSGRFITAGQTLGLNHTTVSRRIAALESALGGRVLSRSAGGWELTELGRRASRAAEDVERAMNGILRSDGPVDPIAGVVRISSTDGFSGFVIAPAVAQLRRRHPRLSVEIENVTRRALQHRSGLDMEVVVGEPQVHRAEAIRLGEYALGMYASREYLDEFGTPATIDDLAGHPLVYFVDSMLQVDDLDAPRRLVPGMQDSLSSTNVFVHVEATRVGAGIGFLPCFLADGHPDLIRILPEDFDERLPYWLVLRADSLRQPAVAAVADALRRRTAQVQTQLLGGSGARE